MSAATAPTATAAPRGGFANARVVARRELAQLFHSALAYVFLIVFIFFVQIFTVLALPKQGTADLRMFFEHLPWGIVLFSAFVTMRSWAEERQENTYEMLLTFPMREWDLVLGKFLASYAFLCTGIACTFTLPLAVGVLGEPDWGPIATGYLGAFLLAAMWCAAGVFVSGLTRSQLLAVIVSAFAGIFSLVLGTGDVARLLDSVFQGLGSFIEVMLGGWSHYTSFAKGVIELADVAYFVGWVVAFLWLNHLYIGVRRTPGSAAILATGTVLAIGSAMLLGRLSAGSSWMRQDLTEGGLYTLSPGTVRILSRAKVPVLVTFYVSPREEMPKEYEHLERQVMDRLHEMEVASGGRLVAVATQAKPENLVDAAPEPAAEGEEPVAPKAEKQTSLEKRLAAKGVQPFGVSSQEAAETSVKFIYATLAIRYREKDEEYLQPILPQRLGELEYLVANTVARLVRARPPKIALHLGEEPLPPEMKQMYRQQLKREIPQPYALVEQLLRQEKFDVERVKLSAHEPMPEDYDALVVIGPENLDERQQWEIDRALVEGRPTLIAAQRYTWEYPQAGAGYRPTPHATELGLDRILDAQGLAVSQDFLMDRNNVQLLFRSGSRDFGMQIRLPTHVLVNSASMSKDSAITRNMSSLFYLWGTGINIDEAKLARNGLTLTKLVESGPQSWTRRSDDLTKLGPKATFSAPADGSFSPQPLAVLVRGQFRSAFEGKERPKWPMRVEDMMRDGRPVPAPPDPPATEAHPAPGQLLLLGCARLWQSEFLGALGNAGFLLNSLDALTLDEDILIVRNKQPADRRFDKQSEASVRLWTLIPLGAVPAAIAACGLFVWFLRSRRREAWESTHRRAA